MNIDDLASRLTITVPEAGALLGLGRGAAYAAAGRGEIPTLRLGQRLVVPVPKLLELVGLDPETRKAPPASDAHAQPQLALIQNQETDLDGTPDTAA